MTPRRRRPLSAEEKRLWAEVARSVKPLPGRPSETSPETPATAVAPSGPEPTPKPPPSSPAPSPAAKRPGAPPAPPLAPLERRQVRALAAGRLRPEGTIDLHGLTQPEAHRRLLGFLRQAQAADRRLVLVITGQGGAGGERGILRRMTPLWLRLPEMRSVVLGFEEAGPRQGGAGALWVRLRRASPGRA